MSRRLAALFLAALFVVGLSPDARAATPQIVDPALDHPAPFADLTSVELKATKVRGRDFLEVTFTVAGEISAPSRNLMTGYTFNGKVGKCELYVLWYAYPMLTEPAGLPTGSSGAHCGKAGKDVGGSYRIKGNAVIVTVPLQDLKGVTRGATVTELKAHTALIEGLDGDDNGVLAYTGDAATGSKPWTIS